MSMETNDVLTLDKVVKDQRKDFHLKVLIWSYRGTNRGDVKAKFDLEARAWIFSQLHPRNGFKIGGGLEETLA